MTLERSASVRADCEQSLAQALVQIEPLKHGQICVLGGTGFVGTWIAEAVAALNDNHGFGIQLSLFGRDPEAFSSAVTHLAARPDITVVRSDIRYLSELPPETNWVINAAGSPDNRVHTSDPIRTYDTIVHGTRMMLEAAERLENLRGVLHLSSGLVNGPAPGAVREDQYAGVDCLRFNSLYAECKRISETLCTAFVNSHRMRVVVARPFAFMGPYQHLDRPWAINNFLRDAIHGGPIRILGNSETVRSYMYPSDMAATILALLIQGRSGQAYNLGSGEPTTLANVAALLADKFSPRLVIVHPAISSRSESISAFVPDTTKTFDLIRLSPAIGLQDAITRTLDWHKSSGMVVK